MAEQTGSRRRGWATTGPGATSRPTNATTAAGTAHVPNAPVLLLVDWPATSTLVGVGPDGTTYASQDGGLAWSRKGTVPGAPVALTATGPSDIHVATDTGIHTSHDAGATFPIRRPLS